MILTVNEASKRTTIFLIECIDGVRQTGFADEIIVEEYEGQKIDDIK